jgi:acyl dehydratase
MTMDLARVGFETAPHRIAWTPAECALYALSLGAGFDEPAFVNDLATSPSQRVYPTFVLAGVMARESATWRHPGLETGDYAVHQIVLGHVALELFGRIEASGDVDVRSRVEGIYDKGRSALVDLSVRAEDRHTGQPLFRAVNSLFIRGEGGFGGVAAPERPTAQMPDRMADVSETVATLPIQSLLYRHAGHDPHPIHVDPEVARRAGMKGPLLHGLNTVGIAGRVILHAVAGGEPDRLRSIEVSFAAPAYNGDLLLVQLWIETSPGDAGAGKTEGCEKLVLFRVLNQEGIAVLERGRARIRAAEPA